MAELKQIHEFACKWIEKFSDPNIKYIELVGHWMADDCRALGFIMDCGQAFSKRYGNAWGDPIILGKIIDEITDISLLGSAVFSQWRYFNHWAYSTKDIMLPENKAWFLIALERIKTLSEEMNAMQSRYYPLTAIQQIEESFCSKLTEGSYIILFCLF